MKLGTKIFSDVVLAVFADIQTLPFMFAIPFLFITLWSNTLSPLMEKSLLMFDFQGHNMNKSNKSHSRRRQLNFSLVQEL